MHKNLFWSTTFCRILFRSQTHKRPSLKLQTSKPSCPTIKQLCCMLFLIFFSEYFSMILDSRYKRLISICDKSMSSLLFAASDSLKSSSTSSKFMIYILPFAEQKIIMSHVPPDFFLYSYVKTRIIASSRKRFESSFSFFIDQKPIPRSSETLIM